MVIVPAIYVNEPGCIPYARAITLNIKPIETRSRDVLGHLVGQRVLIIRTRRNRKPLVIGSVKITGKSFKTAAELDALRDYTLITPGSMFDCKGRGKWCYELSDGIAYEHPMPFAEYNVIHKTRSFAMVAMA